MQMIIGTSCLNFKIAPASLNREDLSHFFVVAWAIHPNLILVEVGCMVPEPKREPIIDVRPLFLWTDEIVHSKQDTLHFKAFVQVLEVHDFSILDSSFDEGGGV
jgi:hypothetical protein